MRAGLGLLAFAVLLVLTACSSSTVSVPAGIPADFTSIVSGLHSAVTETQNDLAGEQRDINMGASNQAGTCVNLVANVDYDVTTIIGQDRQNVIDEVNNLKIAIAAVRQDITDWQFDVQAIANQGVPPPSDEASVISAAYTEILLALNAANGDIDQANTAVDKAYSMANTLASGTCAGHGPGSAPGNIGHLS
jgi:hypothetical protein